LLTYGLTPKQTKWCLANSKCFISYSWKCIYFLFWKCIAIDCLICISFSLNHYILENVPFFFTCFCLVHSAYVTTIKHDEWREKCLEKLTLMQKKPGKKGETVAAQG
jgi:hypothetical protein